MADLKLYILLLSTVSTVLSFLSLDKTIRIDRFLGHCPGKEKLPMYIKDVHINQDHRMYYISCKIVVKEDTTDPLKVLLKPERCKSKESLDTCEPYPDILIRNICDLINIGFQPWTPFVQSFSPHMGCPIRKGTYVSSNGTFDGGAFSAFAVEGWYWKITANIIEPIQNKPNRTIMCLYVEGKVVNI